MKNINSNIAKKTINLPYGSEKLNRDEGKTLRIAVEIYVYKTMLTNCERPKYKPKTRLTTIKKAQKESSPAKDKGIYPDNHVGTPSSVLVPIKTEK